jgi:hypothetical protein
LDTTSYYLFPFNSEEKYNGSGREEYRVFLTYLCHLTSVSHAIVTLTRRIPRFAHCCVLDAADRMCSQPIPLPSDLLSSLILLDKVLKDESNGIIIKFVVFWVVDACSLVAA